jgi:MFS transporter, ACS family, pantothenate transporter
MLIRATSMVAESGSGTTYFNLYLSWAGYSVVQTNVLPTAGSALSVVAAFGFGIWADATGDRLIPTIIVHVLTIVSNVILTVWSVPKAALLFAYYLTYVGAAGQPIVIVSLNADELRSHSQ